MQDKSGLIQEQSVTNSDRRTTISQRSEELNLLPTTQLIAPNIEILPSQMTKSHTKMVNEATCSTTTVDTINSNTNTMVNSMSNDSNQVSSRPQSHLISNNSHLIAGTNNAPASMTAAQTITSNTTSATQNNARTAKRTANDYRFGKTIGEGSFSSVYIAQDIHTKKEVASKSTFYIFLCQKASIFDLIVAKMPFFSFLFLS